MNTTTKTFPDLLHALHDSCQAARNLYINASQRHDSPGLRALKLYLAERHAEHLRDLRQILHNLGLGLRAAPPNQAHVLGLGNEVLRALVSADRAMVLLACSQVEKQLALAYDEVWQDSTLTDAPARAIVGRHVEELESSQDFVRQIEAERSRSPHTSRPSFAPA